MKMNPSLLAVPILLLTTACSTHYSVSSHGHRHHRNHVSVGVHGHGYGHGGEVLGALIIGGIIGHALSEANKDETDIEQGQLSNSERSTDEIANGYPIPNREKNGNVKPERNAEQNRFYQLGKDGKCYLMENIDGKVSIVTAVPDFSCQ